MKKSSTDKTKSNSKNPGTSLMRALEQRIMFDAAVAATIADNVHADTQAAAPAAESVTPDHHELLAAAAAVSETQNQRQEIIFVDTSVTNYQSLVDGINPGAEVVLINAGEDGLQVIADTLEGRSDIDSIHILSHGDTGKIQLGGEWIDSADVAANAELLASIGESLSENGDILLYGCHVGTNGAGVDFIQSLASATGADIAASNDFTGAANLGGDWVLEVSSGAIETTSLTGFAFYQGLLATDQNFDAQTVAGLGSNSVTIGDVTYFNNDSFNIAIVNDGFIASGADHALGYRSSGPNSSTEVGFKTADGSEFKLNSFVIDRGFGSDNSVTITAYRNGAIVDSTTANVSGGTATVNVSGDTDWEYIDEIRITGADLDVDIDDIDFSAAVVPNTNPTTSNLNGDSVAWAGVGGTVSLDAGTAATLADTELDALNDWDDAVLTIQRSGTAVSSDDFGFNTSGASFTVSGTSASGNLQSSGNTFATYTNSGGVMTITFTSSGTAATNALVDNVAQRITYRNDTPAGDATVSYVLTDGDGGTATTATVTVTSDTIYVTNTTDTSTIDITNGVSFSEAVAIAAADATGSQTIVFNSTLASTVLTINAISLTESLTFDMDAATGMSLTSGGITLGAGTTQTFTNGTGDTATISSAIGGSGALTKAGAGGLTLSATNSYSGATTVSAGTLTVSNGDAISTNSSVSVSSGATLALSSNETIGNLSGAGSITLGSNTLTSTITADTTFSGGISGTGGLQVTQSGAATFALTLSGTNTYTGNTTAINFGSLRLNGDASISSSSYLRANGNSVITLLSDQTVGSLGSNNANATINLGSFTLSAGGDNTNTTVSGVISGTGNLVKQGSGTMTLAGSNTYSGTTTVSAGTLSVASDGNLGSNTVTLAAGSTLDITGASNIDNSITLSGNATVSNSDSATLSGAISGANDLTKSGAGTLTLSGTNSYSGTTVSAGTLSVASDSNLGSGTVTLASGTTLTVTGSGVTIDNAIALGGNATISNANSVTLSGIISGANDLTKSGAGTLTLSGTNNHSGTTISAGTLSVGSDSNLGSGAVSLATGTTLAVTGATTIDNNIAITGTGTVSNSATVTLSGVISGGNLTKAGASTLTLSGTNTYTGSTSVSAGTLSVGGDANLGADTINLANGTTLSITGSTTIDNALALTGVVTINAGAAATLSGTISSTGGLTKNGASTLTLSGTNTYSGATTVSAGTLLISGSTDSATTVASGATLAGGGTIDGAVTVQNGGTLSPGSSPGTLTINGNLTMDSGSTLAIEINGTTAGTQYDQVVVNGAVDVSSATLSVTHSYAPGQGDTYTIIDNDGVDAITGTFSGLSQGGTLTASGNSTVLTASYTAGDGNDFTLTAPINAAPTVGNLNGDNPTFTQGSGAILLDASTNATVTDGDSADFDGGNVTVSIVTNGVAGEDVLAIQNQGTGAGQIGVSGSDVTYEGTVIGTFAGGTAGADLVITLDSDATPTAVQALVRNLTYNNTNATNSIDQSDRTIRVTVNDGDGATSSDADITVEVVETVVPTTISIVVDDTALVAGETSDVTITFSEAVTGLTTGDFTVANGTLSGLSSADGGITWTATLTPDASVEDPSNLITLDNTAYTDIAGNAGTGTTDSNNYAIDTLRPGVVSIVVDDTTLAAGETSDVTITFSEAVTGLTTGDFTVENGTLSNLTTLDNITWTATLTPDANEEDASNIITLDNTGYVDAAGNTGTGTTDSNNYAIDTLHPSVVSVVVADTSLSVGETTTVTITFSEPVTGLTVDDFMVENGTLSGLSTLDNITWTATLTPDAGVEDASNLLTVDGPGVVDAVGNTGSNTGISNSYAIDTAAPVNSLPSGQITDAVTQLVFSSGNGNAITVSDGNSLTVVISIGSGTLTASTGGTAGITNNGTGTVTITGTAAEVNTALEGLVYTPNGAGAQTLSIQTTDTIGNVDSDNLAVTVNTATLLVTSNLDTGDDETAAGSFAADQADGGGLSMREALHWARAGDTITFDLDAGTAGNQGGSITLNGTQLQINYSNIKLDGDLNNDGVADVTISANNASRVMAISNSLSGVEITGLTLTQGSTAGGGGALQIGFSSSVTVRDSNLTNSTDAGLGGGGVYGAGATLTMINSTVSGNTSSTFGGGIRIVGSGGTLNLINSTVSGNTTTGASAHGGGIQYGATGTLTIVNSTISGNATTGSTSLGGGLRITSGTAFVYNSTIVGNASTDAGGGVHANGNDTFVNTVVAGNTSGAGATAGASGSPLATGGTADDVGGTIETATNSYFGSNVAIATNNSSLNNQGTSNLLLGNLANYNGSAIQTHRPQVGSALLEAGSNAALPVDTYDLDGDSNTAETLPVDANGDQRVSNIVDIGAVEGNAVPELSNVNGGGTFVENGSAIVIDNDIIVSDNDLDLPNSGNGDYNGASVVIARNGGAVATDNFSFNDGSGISLSGSNLVKNGQTIASFDTSTAGQVTITFTNANGEIPETTDVSAILQQITYSSSSEDPGSSANIDFTLNDGAGASATETASITITEVNDAPTATATATNPTYTENGAAVAVFSGTSINTVESGQTITEMVFTISGLTDGTSENITLDGSSFSISNGATGTTAGNAVDYSISMTGDTATITLTSAGLSAANTQAVVDSISYFNINEMPSDGDRVFTLTSITDSGGTANSGADTTALAIASTVSVDDVNDAPVITAPGSIAVTEDVTTAITGISFSDEDAASLNVTVTISVTSGTLTADTNQPVIIGGTSTNMTLTSNIATINSFIASGYLTFTTDANNSSDVTLTVSIDDNGNTGSGGAQTDSTTVTLDVSAVNDAPVNTIPAAQNVDQDSTLVFNAGNSNLISISDVDAGANTVEVTLTATNGLISLSGITGLSFTTGDGTSDATLTFSGSISDINTALDGLVFTPTGGYNGAASIEITTNDQGWSGSGGALDDTDTINITVDPLNPEITAIASGAADGTYKLGDVITFTVTFDQTVVVDTTGGSPTLLLETGATDRNATYVGGTGTNTLTFSYTVQAGDETADLDYQSTGALALNGSTIESGAGNVAILTLPTAGGVDSIAGQHDLVIDGIIPTASIVVADTALRAGETTTVTITFSEAVSGLTTADFTVANGALSGLTTGDGGITWTATLTPTVDVEDTSNLITLDNTGFVDAAGNTGSGTTDSNNYAIDTERPVVDIAISDYDFTLGETATVTFTFSEAVTDFTNGDITVSNGWLSTVTSSDGGITWTATFTPDANSESTTNVISIDNTAYIDAAFNTGTGTTGSLNYTIDTLRPSAASVVVADTSLLAGETTTVTITFNEAVTGLGAEDFVPFNGTLTDFNSTDGGITWTATLTPNNNVTDATNILIFANNGVVDAVGNPGSGTIDSNNFAIDTRIPTAFISVTNAEVIIGETSPVVIVFNEAITGLTLDDFTWTNGVLSDLSTSDGGMTWSATFTPTANITDITNVITLDNTRFVDAAGNVGVGTTTSNNYVVDTIAPTSSIVVSDTALSAGETATVTITFSERVFGLTVSDFSVANGVLSGLSSSDGGITWTATLTPTADVTDTTNIITLDNTGITDINENTGTGTTDSNNYAIDSALPTVSSITLVGSPAPYANTVHFLVNFSEPVSGIDASDFALNMTGSLSASLGNIVQIDADTWQVTANNILGTGTLRVDVVAGGINDTAGNTITSTFNAGATFNAQLRPNPIAPAPLPPLSPPPATPPNISAPAPLIVLAPINSGNPSTGVLTTVEPPALITVTTPVITSPGMVFNPPGLGSFSPVGLSTLSPSITLGDGPTVSEPGSSGGGTGGRATINGNERSPITSGNAPGFSGGSSAFIDRGAMNSDISLQATPNMGQFTVQPGEAIYIAIPEGTFNANANTQLTVEVRQQNGAPLPSWLVFDPVTGTISGEAPDNFKGKLEIEVIVRDNKGNSATSVMTLSVDEQPLGLFELLHNNNQIAVEKIGKPALENQFARYGEVAREAEANALMHQLKTLSSANTRA